MPTPTPTIKKKTDTFAHADANADADADADADSRKRNDIFAHADADDVADADADADITDIVLLFFQPSGSNKTELHRFLRSEVTSIMDEIGLSKLCLVSDATSAALRVQMEKTNNTLITLADEYRSTLSSLNIGEVGKYKETIF